MDLQGYGEEQDVLCPVTGEVMEYGVHKRINTDYIDFEGKDESDETQKEEITEEGLRWSNIIEEDIAELIREMREQNMSYEDISHLLLLGVSDSMRTALMDGN